MSADVRVSVVIPVTDPDVHIDPLVDGYSAPLRAAGLAHEFVFVLDGISGKIESELADAARRHPVKIVRLQGGGLGESIALSAGVERADGEFIINAPQYLQVEPDDLVKVVRALESGADVVATWRTPRVDPWLNRLQSRLFNIAMRLLMGIKFNDLNSGLRGMRRNVLEQVSVYGDMYRFLPVMAMRQGFRVVEIRVKHREEKGRTGFYGVGVYIRRLLDILAITFLTRFTQKPLRFFGMLGLISIVIGVALAIGPVFEKFTEDQTAAKPILVLGAILIAFGIQLIGFGLVGEIIIFTQARNLKDFKIEEDPPTVDDAGPEPDPMALSTPTNGADLPVRVRELLPGEDARWDSFVRRHGGSFFHLSGWRKAVEDTFHHDPHMLVAECGGEWRGILPLFWSKSPFLGRNLISVPYAVSGGLITGADDAGAQAELLAAAARLGRELGAGYIELRHHEPRCEGASRSDLYVTFRAELPDDPAAVLPAIPKKARAEVRRARDRFSLTCEVTDDVHQLFRLFALNKRRLGSPTLPKRWFRSLIEEFGARAVIHVARDPQGKALASVMSFVHGDTLCAYYSGALFEVRKTGVNDFIYCQIMEWCVEQGLRHFDFGRSRRDTGAAAFKKHMGFVAEPLTYEYVLLADDARPPEFHPSNPKLALPQRIWSRMPLVVANPLGSRLSRYLP